MNIAALIRSMAEAGAPPEAIAIAVEAIESLDAQDAERRAKKAVQKAKERARKATVGRQSGDTLATVARPLPLEPKIPTTIKTQTPPKEKDPKGSTKKVPQIGSVGELWPADAFEQFYSGYPRKKAPQDARKAFAAVQRSGSVTFERLMQGVQTLVATRPDKQFTPYPATWLRAGSWDDEPERLTVNGARGPPKETVQSAAIALEEWTRANDRPDRPLLTAVRR